MNLHSRSATWAFSVGEKLLFEVNNLKGFLSHYYPLVTKEAVATRMSRKGFYVLPDGIVITKREG